MDSFGKRSDDFSTAIDPANWTAERKLQFLEQRYLIDSFHDTLQAMDQMVLGKRKEELDQSNALYDGGDILAAEIIKGRCYKQEGLLEAQQKILMYGAELMNKIFPELNNQYTVFTSDLIESINQELSKDSQ